MAGSSVGSSIPSGEKGTKRVSHACDRCKIRKIKCDGVQPCWQCRRLRADCYFGARRPGGDKLVSSSEIGRLRAQQRVLVAALKELWRRHAQEEPPPNGATASSRTILKDLGLLVQTEQGWNFKQMDPTRNQVLDAEDVEDLLETMERSDIPFSCDQFASRQGETLSPHPTSGQSCPPLQPGQRHLLPRAPLPIPSGTDSSTLSDTAQSVDEDESAWNVHRFRQRRELSDHRDQPIPAAHRFQDSQPTCDMPSAETIRSEPPNLLPRFAQMLPPETCNTSQWMVDYGDMIASDDASNEAAYTSNPSSAVDGYIGCTFPPHTAHDAYAPYG